jgi:hypothetical protein
VSLPLILAPMHNDTSLTNDRDDIVYNFEHRDRKSSYALDHGSYVVMSVSHWYVRVPIIDASPYQPTSF